MRVRVWRYGVPAESREEFEREYGAGGSWARLFARSEGFVDTVLYVDVASPGSYLTVDRFASEAAWLEFLRDHHDAYVAVDRLLRHLAATQEELV